ncbi:endonuclease domain-containing protein (plasmid) [Embleya sp. NBC_00888]|uniref:hypothetical protein n=1 Tax=Embleya sp. NBC_00888 TaxID=2975960 RepID=UPI00386727C7|nr:endonuclease domain-containing protein [Embleya sp. NBC_00888]
MSGFAVGTSALYARLRESVKAAKSPPQLLLFDLYHDICGAFVADPPALLPEVWLHWDPKTVRARGRDALLKFRMDFLLLLPHGRRVVIEVDGKTHYGDGDRADPATYAMTMRADRDLKLAGYEVFRFGCHDLRARPGRADGPTISRGPVHRVRRHHVVKADGMQIGHLRGERVAREGLDGGPGLDAVGRGTRVDHRTRGWLGGAVNPVARGADRHGGGSARGVSRVSISGPGGTPPQRAGLAHGIATRSASHWYRNIAMLVA